jgi:hypothetical protein
MTDIRKSTRAGPKRDSTTLIYSFRSIMMRNEMNILEKQGKLMPSYVFGAKTKPI